jgi:hypothetical protein
MTQAPEAPARSRAQISERTFRKDPWWQSPRITAAGLTIWVLYATVRVSAASSWTPPPPAAPGYAGWQRASRSPCG